MNKENIIDILANALLGCEQINYIVRIHNGKGLQIQTSNKRHYNLALSEIDSSKAHIVKLRQETKER